MPTDNAVLPAAFQPLQAALAGFADLRAKLALAEADAGEAAAEEAASDRKAEDALAAGTDPADAFADAERWRAAGRLARSQAAGFRRLIASEEGKLPALVAEARQALHGFEADAMRRIEGRWRKLLPQVLAVLAEASALKWITGQGDGAAALSRVKLPASLDDTTQTWRGLGVGVGDTPAEPSDAARQVAEVQALLREAEAVAGRAGEREAA